MKKGLKNLCSVVLAVSLVFTMLLAGSVYAWADDAPAETAAGSASGKTYTVLVIDTSGSMWGTPLEAAKKAMMNFCEALVEPGSSYIALVTLNTHANAISEFTDDAAVLSKKISALVAGGNTNVTEALEKADGLLAGVKEADAYKSVVLSSDGLPKSGDTALQGKYSVADSAGYFAHANVAYNTAYEMKTKKNETIFTVGFFHSLRGEELAFGQKFMKDLASEVDSAPAYYEATDEKSLGTVLEEVVKEIHKKPVPSDKKDEITGPAIVLDENKTEMEITLKVGQTLEIKARVVPSDYANQDIEWWSDRDAIAAVTEDGKITGISAGKTNCQATLKGENIGAKVNVTVVEESDELPGDGKNDNVNGFGDAEDYDDDPLEAGGELKNNVDVKSITFTQHSMNITCGNSKNVEFTTDPEGVSAEDLNWTSEDDSIAELAEDDPSRIIGVAVGTTTVIASAGEATAAIEVTVAPKGTSFTKLVSGNKKIGVKWKMATTANADGYQIQYSPMKNFSSSVKSGTIKKRRTTSVTIRSPKNGRTLYFRIRTYKNADGKKIYSNWSAVKSVKPKN